MSVAAICLADERLPTDDKLAGRAATLPLPYLGPIQQGNPSMITRTLTARFLTPAFLGDADQNAGWRTPPFKHALRRWWRVAWMASANGTAAHMYTMRDAEGRLFGDAREQQTRQSQIRLRLKSLDGETGQAADAWAGRTAVGVAPMPTGIETGHAWFGLINRGRGIADRNRLEAGEARRLDLAFPEAFAAELDQAIALIGNFATLGTRSRGGWGSLELEGIEPFTRSKIQTFSRDLSDCLGYNWPLAVASDDRGPWVWRSTSTFSKWHDAMSQSAQWRRQVRSAIKGPLDLRKALGFAANGRMPNPLHWKLIKDVDGQKLQVAAFPHTLPVDSGSRMRKDQLVSAWETVAKHLDGLMSRVA